jgi:hypothetical protein
MAPPDGTDDKNQRPEEKNDSLKLVAPQSAKMPGAIAFEDGRADKRSEALVEKNHRRTRANIPVAGRNAPDWSGPESFRLSLRVGQLLRYSSTFALCFDL